jgi:hypothetical protein
MNEIDRINSLISGSEITTPYFWDCECSVNYIHPRSRLVCSICGSMRDEQPDSIKSEVIKLLETKGNHFSKAEAFKEARAMSKRLNGLHVYVMECLENGEEFYQITTNPKIGEAFGDMVIMSFEDGKIDQIKIK